MKTLAIAITFAIACFGVVAAETPAKQNAAPAPDATVKVKERKNSGDVAAKVAETVVSPAPEGKYLGKVTFDLSNPTDDVLDRVTVFAVFIKVPGNLVLLSRPAIMASKDLGVAMPPEAPADLFAAPVPLVSAQSLAPNQKYTFAMEVPFKPGKQELDFPCFPDKAAKGAFVVQLYLGEKTTTSASDLTKIGEPVCVGPVAARPVVATKPKFSEEEQISLGSVHFERALVGKTIADEHFLRDLKDEADAKYVEALKSLRDAEEFTAENKTLAARRLLEADIAYRRTLIALGMDFWGGYRTRTPGIPVRHLIALEDLVNEFERVMKQLDDSSAAQKEDDKDILKARGALQEVTGKLNAYLMEKEKGAISERRERRTIDVSWGELRDVQAQQARIGKRLETIASLQRNLQSQANKMLTNAVAKSAGIDPALIEGVRTGNVEQIVKQYVASQVADPNSDLMKQVAAFSKESDKFVDLYKRARKTEEDVKAFKGEVEFAAEAMRKPSLDRLRELGGKLLEHMPPEEQARVKGVIRAQLPAPEWLRGAQQALAQAGKGDAALRQVVARELGKAGYSASELRQFVFGARDRMFGEAERNAADVDRVARDVLSRLAAMATTADSAKSALVVSARALPSSAIEKWPPELVSWLKVSLNVSSTDELRDKLERGAMKDLAFLDAGPGTLRIRNEVLNSEVRVRTAELFSVLEVSRSSASKASAELSQLMDGILLESRRNAEAVLGALPAESLTGFVVRSGNGEQASAIAASVQAFLSKEGLLEEAASSATATALGAIYAGPVFDQVPLAGNGMETGARDATALEEPGAESGTGGQPDATTNAIITAALDAAFPGAGTLFSMAQAFGSMDANRDLAERLAAEGVRLMARKNELVDRQSERYADAMLAEVEQRRARALADASDAQISTFQNAMRRAVEESNIQRARLGVRRGWAFYLSERMREEFDQFDRAFALWARGKAQRGVIEQEIRNDPQNVRYALDSQIQLFDWLDRSRESAKTDPDLLRVHWNKMLRLAKDSCQKLGCKPGDGMMGQVGHTREVGIIGELLSAGDRQRFREWQKNPLGTFRAEFQVTPMSGLVPPTAQNVRLIDLRLAHLAEDRKLGAAEQVSLTHTGVSYIGIESDAADGTLQYSLESMLPRTASSFNATAEYDLEALRTRYDGYFTGSNLPSPRLFEGYGLLASYQLSVEPTPANRTLKDLMFRAAYFYQHVGMIQSEAAFVRKLAPPKGPNDRRISLRYPEISPIAIAIGSDTTGCVLPSTEPGGREDFHRAELMPVRDYEAISFFGARPVSRWRPDRNVRVRQMQDELAKWRRCSLSEPVPTCKRWIDVEERAKSIGARIDRGPNAASDKQQLGLPIGSLLAVELPRLAADEYQQQCSKEMPTWNASLAAWR